MLEGQLELFIIKKEVEQITSVYQSRHMQYSTYTAGIQVGRAYLYGVEYETAGGNDGPLRSIADHNVPCAVCYSATRGTVVSNRWTGLWTGSLDWIAGLDSEERCQTSMQDCMCSEDLCLARYTDVAEPQKRSARFTINLNKATNYGAKFTKPTARK